ncbi:hypothetical protein DSO57_1029966 [Entomophthora muscae]|uniref:Uncharacterized protein n=1 Tax=Entomophthora muscae TaxID=34485 RepID=A0ACC2TCL5_9FUNG|nr:hypothetical protein DSO57_1029966 [Entomophthora muscae]
MNLWFKQILPYLVLVIFHLNSSQIDHQATALSRDQPANPHQALYHPSGAPFGPLHFTKYPPNPAYLETILIANPLARTRDTECIGHKGKRIKLLPLLFKYKYNYLLAYFVPMTLPLTLRPNLPMDPPTAAKTTSTQLFGIFYITLTGILDTIDKEHLLGKLQIWIGREENCGRDLVGLNLGASHVQDGFRPLDTWIVM